MSGTDGSSTEAHRAARGASTHVGEEGGGGRALPEPEFSLSLRGDARWRVHAFEVVEALSTIPTAVITAVAEGRDADPDAALGHDAHLTVSRLGRTRRHSGIVSRVEHLGALDGKVCARLTVVPALWALSQRVDSRIYESRTVREVVDDVLQRALAPYQRAARWALQRVLTPREHTVQYQETDLAFIERLLAEEGISYAVVPGEHVEEVVFFDAVTALPSHDAPVEVIDESHATHAREGLRRFGSDRALTPTHAAVRDYDWSRPGMSVAAERAVIDDPAGRARPVYAHPADVERGAYDDGAHAWTQHDAGFRALLTAQRLAQRAREFSAEGNLTGLHPGLRVRLLGHRDPSLDRGYVVTSVKHIGRAPEALRAGGDPLSERFVSALRCVADDVAIRPEKSRARARIYGPQTAVVVTTSEDDAQSEHHGRVRVRFHWERDGAPSEAQRAWVRVAQSWAGADYGVQFIPRKGMEVVVHFLEGDPDRPLVTGVVYNGAHPLPFPIDAHATRSGIRTHSTDGQGGALVGHFNELSFEDHAGREEVYLRAQRNLREKVRNDHGTHVLHDQSNTVDNDHAELIGRDQKLTVRRDRKVEVKHDQEVRVGHDLDTRVDHHEERFVGGTGRSTRVQTLDSREVEGDDALRVTGNLNASVLGTTNLEHLGAHFHLVHEGASGTTVHFDQNHAKWLSRKSIYIDNPVGEIKLEGVELTVRSKQDAVVINCGQAVIFVKKDGTVWVEGGKEIDLKSGPARARLSHDGSVSVEGTKRVSLKSGGGSLEITPTDVVVKATGKIKLNA